MENNQVELKQTSLKISKLIFFLCALVYASAYIARGNFSVAVDLMKTTGTIDANIAGLISGIYFMCYTIGQVINGILGDKISPIRMIIIGVLLIIISEALMGLIVSPSYLLIIWWGINGFGQSMLWAPIFYILNNYVHKDYTFKALTLFSLTTPFGKIASYFLSALSLDITNNLWQSVFYMASIIMIIVLTLWITINLSIKDKIVKRDVKDKNKETTKKVKLGKLFLTTGLLFALPSLLVHGLFLNGATEWVPSIITNQFNIDPSLTGYIVMIIPAVGILGVFMCVSVYKKWFKKNEGFTAIFFMILSLILVFILYIIVKSSISNTILACIIFVVFYGLLYMTQLGFNHLLSSMVPMHFTTFGCAATIAGIINAFNYGGSAISTYFISLVVDNMDILFIIWIASLLVAIITLFIFTPKWIKFSKDTEINC